MRLCILGLARTGSTSLFYMIKDHVEKNGFTCISEPFHPPHINFYKTKFGCDFNKVDDLLKYDDLLIKTLIGSDQYPTNQFKSYEDFLVWLESTFDKIIVLSRKNKKEQAESFVVNSQSNVSWHTPKIYDVKKMNLTFVDEMEESFIVNEKILFDFAKQNNHPIFFYEDIFIEHNIEITKILLEYFGLKLEMEPYENWVIKDRRVRKDPPEIDKLF